MEKELLDFFKALAEGEVESLLLDLISKDIDDSEVLDVLMRNMEASDD